VTAPRPDAEARRLAREAAQDAAIERAADSIAAGVPPLAEWQRERLRALLDLSGPDDAG
jgi:hypothetical protein